MNKKIILRLLLLVILSIFFSSCRTDEVTQEEKRNEREKIEAFARFEENMTSKNFLQKNASEYVSYHEPFMNIIQTFMDKNPEYSKKFQDQVGDVYFDLRSVTYGDSNKGIVYPIMKDGKVNAALLGIINIERDWVNFTVLKNDTREVQSIISKFQKTYDSNQLSRGREKIQEEQIDEVVITVYQSIPGPSYIFTYPFIDYGGNEGGGGLGGGMSGGGAIHGGSGGTPANPPNPCEKTKKEINDPIVKAKIKDLQDHLANGANAGEKGWRFNKDGTPSETTGNSGHQVTFGDPSTMNGGYHNHPGTGVKIFSATDIATLIEIARYQSQGNVGNAYMGLVSPGNIHYSIHFNGNHTNLPTYGSYTKEQLKDWNDKQWDNYLNMIGDNSTSINQKLEQVFFLTLEVMELKDKIILQKIDTNNKIFTVNQKSDGTTIPVPCN